MKQMYFSPSIIIFVNIYRSPADVSFIYKRQDPHSPRVLVQWSLSLQLPLQSCYSHASLLCTLQTIGWPILVLAILPTCSAHIKGEQDSAWEVACTRGKSMLNLRIAGG